MRLIVKEGTLVKVKSKEELEQLLDEGHRINGLYIDEDMFNYCGQELKVIDSNWNSAYGNSIQLEGNSWFWNLDCFEEIGEENMRDLDRICADCGNEIEEGEELTYIEEYDRYVCSDCLEYYHECDDCGRMVHEDDLHSVDNGNRSVCDSCYDDYQYCADCGEYFYRDDMYYDEDSDEYYCEDCWENNGSHLICGYHQYDRDFEFYKGQDEVEPPYYIGRELEMENDEIDVDCVRYIKDELNGITSRDGSLSGRGAMEWVDHPRSMKNHYEIADKIEGIFKRLVDSGYRSNDTSTCGLHFHVSRPYQQEIDKLGRDMWGNDIDDTQRKEMQKEIEELENKQEDIINRIILVMESFKQELIRFSRRKDTYWCQWLSDVVTCDNGKITSLDFIKKVKGESYGHHRALNLENHNTIEFRIFKGTLNFNTYMASLELVNNIVALCSDLKLPVEKITWEKLTKGEYVSKYVQEREIVCTHRVVDTSEIDRIWEIVKNKKKGKVAKKVYNLLNKYYNEYVNKFNEVKDSEKWALICDITSKLREHSNNMERVLEYKNNNEYSSMFSKVQEMVDYYMYFDTDTLKAIRTSIRELLNEVR